HPYREIFVYATWMEGVHLRGAKVARGGIRWSDRRDDFRTEILGLMKTQQVKNAVIVPMGAKGGFIVKDKESKDGIECYKTLVRGLLDITDNINLAENKIIKPESVVSYDEDDPYLVVAADKGTATFSDIANGVSMEYGFWLGDAFASGGSAGYDHKKMGITARGAWESVKRHFLDLGHDIQTTPFTVVGIGDMAGDVFGNGMLLSNQIQLIGAFNHAHIFIDPNPDPAKSFQERKRLFETPRSKWSDYNSDLISPGGGIFSREAKIIELSPEIMSRLNINTPKLVPSELIRALLKAPVDLLWNGGIGTFVKASYQSDSDAGDRGNDALRVNANDLKCKVVGEGGNLGFTQLARVQYAALGGKINTDAIDNSGGVNCSDNEVNIKILLNAVVQAGELTEKQRNHLLVEMTEEVGELVLKNNRVQNEAISITASKAEENLEMHSRLMEEFEKAGKLNRKLEFLPNKEEVELRKSKKEGLTRPEIAVLMAYAKNVLKNDLLNSDLPDQEYSEVELFNYFPKELSQKFESYLPKHRLKREIISTQWANIVINEMGINFISRLTDETGTNSEDAIKAFMISREVFDLSGIRKELLSLNNQIPVELQFSILHELNRLIRRGTRWFLRNRRSGLEINKNIEQFKTQIQYLFNNLNQLLIAETSQKFNKKSKNLEASGMPIGLAHKIAGMDIMYSALDIVDASVSHQLPIDNVSKLYFAIGEELSLGWFRDQIKIKEVKDHWEALARASFRDDLDRQQRTLTVAILNHDASEDAQDQNLEKIIMVWLKRNHHSLSRWYYFIEELKRSIVPEFTMFSVALRELLDLAQMSTHIKKY
ncbi:MAG: NAD-glutamate dehydrogenase domain-containing protein, partial [Gammaproteobacteria bacterium]